jgi:hypothetical protein
MSVSTIDDDLARAVLARAQPQGLSAAVSGAPERLSQRQRIDDKVPFRHHFHEMMTQRRGLRISHART